MTLSKQRRLAALTPDDVARAIDFQSTSGSLHRMVRALPRDVFTALHLECQRLLCEAAMDVFDKVDRSEVEET